MNQKFYLMPCLYNSPFKPFIAMNIKITLREILIEGKSRCTSTINISQGRFHFVENPNFAEFTGNFKLMDYGFAFFFAFVWIEKHFEYYMYKLCFYCICTWTKVLQVKRITFHKLIFWCRAFTASVWKLRSLDFHVKFRTGNFVVAFGGGGVWDEPQSQFCPFLGY